MLLRKIFTEFVNWHDVWIFIASLYLMIELNSHFSAIPDFDQTLLQNYLEWYAVFYAISLSVIVSEAWSRHNRINAEIDRESDALKLLVHTSRIFPDKSLSKNLVLSVHAYAVSALKLNCTDSRSTADTRRKMKKIQTDVYELIVNTRDPFHEALKAELLHQYCEAYDARGDRFDLLAQKMPSQVWIILGLFSLAWLWGFLWLKIEDKMVAQYIVGCTAWGIGYMYYMARDLNDPKKGSWKLDFKPFINNLF